MQYLVTVIHDKSDLATSDEHPYCNSAHTALISADQSVSAGVPPDQVPDAI